MVPYIEKHGFGWQILLNVIRKLNKPFLIFWTMNRTLEWRPYEQPNNFVNRKKRKGKKKEDWNTYIVTLKPLEIGKYSNSFAAIADHFFSCMAPMYQVMGLIMWALSTLEILSGSMRCSWYKEGIGSVFSVDIYKFSKWTSLFITYV